MLPSPPALGLSCVSAITTGPDASTASLTASCTASSAESKFHPQPTQANREFTASSASSPDAQTTGHIRRSRLPEKPIAKLSTVPCKSSRAPRLRYTEAAGAIIVHCTLSGRRKVSWRALTTSRRPKARRRSKSRAASWPCQCADTSGMRRVHPPVEHPLGDICMQIKTADDRNRLAHKSAQARQ